MAGKLSGKKVAIVVAHEFEDVELLYPLLRLSEEGAEIIVVPVPEGLHPRPYFEGKPVTGRFGHTVPIPVMAEGYRYTVGSLEQLRAAKVDCLLFPGGYSPDALRLHKETLDLIREYHRQGKLLAAICHGPWVLISAGIVRGRRLTSTSAIRDDLVNAGAEWVDAPAVVDGNLVSARVPKDLPAFARAMLGVLGGT